MTKIPLSGIAPIKKGGEAATSTLNPEPNEGKVKRTSLQMCFFVNQQLVPLSPFPHPRFTGLRERSLHFGRDDRWKTGNLT